MAFRHIFQIADGLSVVNNGVSATPYPLITADGNYPGANGFEWQGGTGTLEVFGTFGGGTAKLQMRGIDSATWIDMGAALTLTAPGVVGFVAGNRRLRLNVSGSTAPSLSAAATAIPGG